MEKICWELFSWQEKFDNRIVEIVMNGKIDRNTN